MIPGLGTIINAAAIIASGILGVMCKRLIRESWQETVLKATGFAVIFIGAAGTLSKMLSVTETGALSASGSISLSLSLALGALIGEILNIDSRLQRFGAWLRARSGSSGDSRFIDGFVTSSLSVGIGAMGLMVAKNPIAIMKGFWEYRWMGSFLGTFLFIDRLFEG